tara:strand:+ start:10207 stop:11454 length:1248 start_codon:yes stop_codon:yes gene_type:complete
MKQLPPTTPEQRLELLADTQELISPGFLSAKVVINGVTISFRSPYPSDYFILGHAFEFGSEPWATALIARLVWLVDGYSCFNNPDFEYEIRDLLRSIPRGSYSKLFACVGHLIRRHNKARESVINFLWEETSRDLWRGFGKKSPNLDVSTGIVGLESLGLNACQKVWVAWNEAEDQRTKDEFEWTLVKQSISPHAPKAIEKMNKREKQQDETRAKDRKKKQDEWYYKVTGVLDENGKLITKKGEEIDPYAGDQVSMAYTSDELAEEMRRWVTGEQDWHDRVIQEYKAGIKTKMLEERMERDRRLEEAQQEMEERQRNLGIRSRDRLVGYTPDQVKKFKEESGFDPERPGARTIAYAPSRKQSAFDKWVDAERSSGALVEEGGKLVPKKEIPRPEKDERSLQDKISSRLPRLDRGD